MKFRKKLPLVLLTLLLSLSSLFATNNSIKGIDLCNSVYNFLDKYNFSPSTQNLVTTGINAFPYNIIINKKSDEKTNNNLMFVFYQEDILSNKTNIINFLSYINKTKFDFNIIILFAYGDKTILKNDNQISGIQVFLNTINSNEEYCSIIFDLQNEQNKLITSSNGFTSPSWLIQNEYNSYLQNNLDKNLPFTYISQLYQLKFFNDVDLSYFFEKNVPAIKLCLTNNKENSNAINNIMISSIENYAETNNKLWDHHFLMIRLLGSFRKVSESFIINVIILIIFCWLLFIFILGFVNTRLRRHTWSTINDIWYSIPVTFIIICISFLIGNFICKNIFSHFSDFGKVYSCFSFEIFLSFIFVTLYYLFTLQNNYKFEEKTIDFLLVISTFINQFVFILLDISLFPIFMFICCLSILALLIKNNILHICIFILTILPFIFYSHNVISNADISLLSSYIFSDYYLSLYFSLIMYPIFLIYFRILTSFRAHSKNKNSLLLSTLIFAVSLFIVISTLSIFRIHNYNKNNKTDNNYTIELSNDHSIDFDYTDKNVFSDVIRTIKIKLDSVPEICTVKINTLSKSPILYTDNEYVLQSPTSAYFKIPGNPPSEMSFSYGTTSDTSNIIITAVYQTDDNKYSYVSKSITIGE